MPQQKNRRPADKSDVGLLGSIFGGPTSASRNTFCLIAVICMLGLIAVALFRGTEEAVGLWNGVLAKVLLASSLAGGAGRFLPSSA